MKSKRAILLVSMALIIFLGGCSNKENSIESTPAQANVSNDVSAAEDSSTAPATDAPRPATETEVTTDIEEKQYAKAYYDAIMSLINQYGFAVNPNDSFKGFIRGDLIDFEKDEMPELVCIYGKGGRFCNIRIYEYSNSQAILLVDELTGDSIIGDSMSQICFNEIDGKPYVVTEKCDWGEVERIKVFSVEKSNLITRTLTSDVIIDDSGDAPDIQFRNCLLDGKNVTEEEYLEQRGYFYKDSSFWIYYLEENGECRSYIKEDASNFLKMLAFGAGVDEKDVSAALCASLPTQSALPDWRYDLKSDGLYRTDRISGDIVKINDQGYAAGIIITDDWLYYRDNGCLYRMDNESVRELLTDEECWCPRMNENSIYYISNRGIFKMGFDGTGKEQILECDCNEMVVTDNYIFYALNVPDVEELNSLPGAEDGPTYIGELRRVGLSGEGDMKIEGMISELSVMDDTVYFTEAEDARLYAMNPATLERKLFCDGFSIKDLYFGGGYAFYVLDRHLFRMSLMDGTLIELTQGSWDMCYGVLDGYVYVFINADDIADSGVYRIRLDDNELEKVE